MKQTRNVPCIVMCTPTGHPVMIRWSKRNDFIARYDCGVVDGIEPGKPSGRTKTVLADLARAWDTAGWPVRAIQCRSIIRRLNARGE